MTDPTSGLDVVAFVERLAERLRTGGAEHPVAAAVAQAARGHRRLDAAAHAALVGVAPARLRAMESGQVPFADLPDPLVDWLTPDELLQLADLDRDFGPDGPPADGRPLTDG